MDVQHAYALVVSATAAGGATTAATTTIKGEPRHVSIRTRISRATRLQQAPIRANGNGSNGAQKKRTNVERLHNIARRDMSWAHRSSTTDAKQYGWWTRTIGGHQEQFGSSTSTSPTHQSLQQTGSRQLLAA